MPNAAAVDPVESGNTAATMVTMNGNILEMSRLFLLLDFFFLFVFVLDTPPYASPQA